MTIKIPIEVAAKGIQQTVAEFQNMQKTLGTIAKNSAGFDTLARSMGISYKEAKTLATSLNMTGQAVASTAQGIKQLTAIGANSATQFQVLSAKLGITANQFQAISAALNATKGSVGAATAGNMALANAMGGSYNQAQKLATGLGMSSEKAAAAVTRLKELNAVNADAATKFATLSKELGVTSEQFQQLDQVAGTTQQGLGAVAAVSGAISGAIGATFVASSKVAADFNKEMQTFGVVSGSINTKGFEDVRAEVERLAAATSKSPQEIAALATEMARAGFTADQTKEALAGVVQSSEATGEGLVRTGEVIGATLNQFGLQAKDSTKIADLLTQASNVSASGTNDLGEALSYVGAQAKASNQSVEDTVTTLALLANSGIKGSSAGTGLAEALRRIKIASASASTELDELRARGSKTAVEAFGKLSGEVRNADGSLKPFPQILGTVKNSLGTLSKGDQDLMMNALFGVQGGRVVQSLLVQSDEKIKQVTDSMEEFEGSAAKASAEMQKGMGPSLKILEGSAQLAGIKIGEVVNVGLLPLVKGATLLVNGFLALPGPVQAALVVMTGFVGVLAAATAAIAAYNLMKGAQVVAEFKSASMTVLGTKALLEKKIVMLSNIVVQSALTGGRIALAVATGKFAAAQKLATAATLTATPAMTALSATMVAVLGPMIALGAAVALISFVKMTADMKAVNEELDVLANNSTNSMNEFGQIAGRVKGLNNAFKETGQFTEEQKRIAQGYINISKEKIKAIEAEIAAAEAIASNPNASAEQKSAAEAAVAGLQAQKQALESQTATLEQNIAATTERTKAIETAEDAEKALKQVTEDMASGKINEKDAIKQLEAIRNNANAGKKVREDAANEIMKLIENKAKEEEAILEGQLAKGVISREQYNQKLTQTQMSANSAEIAQLEAQLKTLAATDEAGRREVNAKLGEAYKKRADIQRAAYQRDLEMIDERNDKALDAAKLAETQRDIEIAKLRKSGQFSEGELAQKEIESKIKNIDAELAAERKKYEEIKKLKPATEEDRAKQEDQLRASQQKMADLTLQRVNQEIAAEENLRKQAIAAIKERQQAAKLATDETVRGIRSQVGELNQQNHAQEMILKSLDREQKLRESAAALVSAQMQAEVSRYNAQIEALNTAIGLVKEAREAEGNPDDKRLKALDEEQQKIAEIKTAREEALKAEYAPQDGDNEKTAAEKQKKLAEESKKLQEEFAGAEQRNAAETKRLNAEVAAKKKADEEAAKARQQQLLAALGLAGKTELELIQRKQKLEDQQAAAKAKAQQAEMALARQQMEMNVKRMAVEARMQLIAAKRAELEAKISVEKAKQSVTDAKAELAQAKLIQDPKERKAAEADAKSKIKDAELDLKLTEDEYAAAQDNTRFSKQNIEDTKVLAAQQQETLAIQQQSANEVARQEEGLRTMNQALELSKAGAEGFAGALDKAAKSAELIQQSLGTKPAAPQARRLGGSVRAGEPYLVGEAGPELITPSRNGWVFTAKQTAKILADVQPANAAALPTGTISQIVAFRRDAAMLEELKKLRGQVEGMRPVQERNTFNLNSNQLVADAAELHLKIARNRLRRSRR